VFWWICTANRRQKLPADQLIKRKLTSTGCGEVSSCLPKPQRPKDQKKKKEKGKKEKKSHTTISSTE